MIEELSTIKEQLFDAPADVKQAFNNVVKYFDDLKNFRIYYNLGSQTKQYTFEAKDLNEAKSLLEKWKKIYPNWIDYKTAKLVEVKDEYYWIAYIYKRVSKPSYVIFSGDQQILVGEWFEDFKIGARSNKGSAEIVRGPFKTYEEAQKVFNESKFNK